MVRLHQPEAGRSNRVDGADSRLHSHVWLPSGLSTRPGTDIHVPYLLLTGLVSALAAVVVVPATLWQALTVLLWVGFAGVVLFKAACCVVPPRATIAPSNRPRRWPHYTVVVALKDEAAIVPQLVRRLSRLNYPNSALTGLLVVEPDDRATLDAILDTPKPSWLKPLIAPRGHPQTKPRALNVALEQARPGLLTVYDAEDEPHPDQLREAALRFATGDRQLACLQAPLRIRTLGRRSTWLERQFAMEYAALFEVILPALARFRLPLPLGGTSNHFRVDVLRRIGGWDAWNVTEDADLGFRLARFGYRSDVLGLPTRESPPPNLKAWLPQRTRWLKGFMQTIGVNLRCPIGLRTSGMIVLALTLAAAVASAALQGVVLTWIVANFLIHALNGSLPSIAPQDSVLLLLGWAVALAALALGCRRSGIAVDAWTIVTAPLYWSLTTIAQVHAVWRLVVQPYHWDKTPHAPDIELALRKRRTLRNRARLSTYAASHQSVPDTWKSRISTSTTTPTSGPE